MFGITAVPGIPGAAHRIDLINENNTGSYLSCLLEQIPHPACAHTHEHLHKVRAGNREERYIRFTGNCLGKQRLTRTGRAYQQRALRQLCANLCILLGIVEEIDNFLQRFFRFILTGNILEGNTGLLFHIHLGLAGADTAHHTFAAEALGNRTD